MQPPYKPRPFRHKAVYCFTCLCGYQTESEEASGICPSCNRAWEIHNWGGRESRPKNMAFIKAVPPLKREGSNDV